MLTPLLAVVVCLRQSPGFAKIWAKSESDWLQFVTRRRSTSLRTDSIFPREGKWGDFRQARHEDLSKARAEAIEPALDADGCDRKILDSGGVNSFDPNVPRGDTRCHESFFVPQPPCDERGEAYDIGDQASSHSIGRLTLGLTSRTRAAILEIGAGINIRS